MAKDDPYRASSELAADTPDPEVLAIAELASRARYVRLSVVFSTLLVGIVSGIALVHRTAAMFPRPRGLGAYCVVGSLMLAIALLIRWVATALPRAILARRVPSWIAELAARHEVRREMLEGFARALSNGGSGGAS